MNFPRGSIPYGRGVLGIPSRPFRLEIPETPDAGSSEPLTDAAIGAVLDRPTHGPGVRVLFRRARRTLIVVSDATRSTGAGRFLPPLVDRVDKASAGAIRFAVGSGLHRPPEPQEVERIIGPELVARYEVILHDPNDPDNLVDVGRTRAGTPVRVHRALVEHDRIVLTGAAGFHYYAGFTGGRKAIVPGMAGRKTIECNHLRALRRDGSRHPLARAGRLAGNPVHRDMVEGAALLEPAFLVNSVMHEDGEIERLFTGHWRRAHEAACRHIRRTRRRKVTARDVVVVSAGGYPHDINAIQAHKAFEAAYPALRPGGVLILVAECRDGGGHRDFLDAFEHPTVDDHVKNMVRDFRVYSQTALAWRRKLATCRLVLVSSLDPDVVRKLGAEPATDLAEALDRAARTVPRDAAGWMFPHGVRWLLESRE